MMSIVAAIILTLGALAVDGWLVHHDRALDVLTPSPSRVVQSFIGALGARRPASAEQHLAEAARDPGTMARLRAAAASGDRLRFEDAVTHRAGDRAEVQARVRRARATEHHQIRLERDPATRLWKITTFD